MTLKLGDKAPTFVLKDTDLKDVDLTSYQGKKVLLLFFPFAFTGVCTTELCQTTEDLSIYTDMDAVVIGVSVDSPFTLAKFKEENKIGIPLLSDFNKAVSRSYDVLYEEFVYGLKGVSKRSAFVIDEKGVIKYAEVLENAGNLPNFEAIQDALNKLI